MNRERLQQVYNLIRYFQDHEPDLFDYKSIMDNYDDDHHIEESITKLNITDDLINNAAEGTRCGTMGCIAGWTLALNKKEILSPHYKEPTVRLDAFAFDKAQELLGLTYYEACFLFMPMVYENNECSFYDYKSENFDLFDYQEYPKSDNDKAIQEALDRIQYLLSPSYTIAKNN